MENLFYVLAKAYISLRQKGIQFAPPLEKKIDWHQLQKDLEDLGTHISLWIYYHYVPRDKFSTSSCFWVPSN